MTAQDPAGLREAFMAGCAYGRGLAGLDFDAFHEAAVGYADYYVAVWGAAFAATGDSGGPLDVRKAVVANFRARVVKAKGTQQALDYTQLLDWAWDEEALAARLSSKEAGK